MKLDNTQRLILALIAAVLFVVSAYAQAPTAFGGPVQLQDLVSGKLVPNNLIEPSGVAAALDAELFQRSKSHRQHHG